MDTILQVTQLRKEYPGFTLDDLSFSLDRGYVMGFIGPNGAGKTTTIKLIMNLLLRDGGTIEVFGLDNGRYEREIKERIGFVYDSSPFYGVLTVAEMKSVIAGFYSNWNDGLFAHYLKQFDLPADRQIDNLSRGMQMKFSLAVALSHGAELIIMDEPTSGLDPVFRSELLDILYEIMQDGNRSIFFSTHITGDLEKIADYITFINDGHLVFSEPKDDVLDAYALVKGPHEVLQAEAVGHFVGIREHGSGFEALTRDVGGVRRTFGDRVLIEKASLEDIMVYSVRRQTHA